MQTNELLSKGLDSRRRYIFWGAVLFLMVSSFFLGYLAKGKAERKKVDTPVHSGEEANVFSDSLTNPLLECKDIPRELSIGSVEKIRQSVEEKIEKAVNDPKIEHVSVFFQDLNNGSTFGVNEKEMFTPASLMKVPLAITYYKLAENDPDLLKKKITYKKDPYENQVVENFIPKKSLEEGKTYEIQEIIETMIKNSDNHSVNALLKEADPNDLFGSLDSFGIETPMNIRGIENFMRVKDYAALFRVLYNSSYLKREFSEKLLDLLSQTEFKDGLVAGVSRETKVSHKFGERKVENRFQLHDCGIVYFPKHPYLLCVMTRGDSFERLEGIISGISREVFFGVQETTKE